MGVGACHIRPESHSPRAPRSPCRAAARFPRLSPQARPAVLPHAPATGPRRRREGLPERRREPATSPQDGGRHHRDSPRRGPSPTRKKKKPEDGARLERSEQAQGAATQCAGVNRNSARELEAGRWVVLECRRRVAGVRRRTSQAAALAEAWSGPRSCSSSAYVQAPPSGASCATRSFGTATWSPGLVVADQRARNLEGGEAGGALVEGLSRARPQGARVASQACVMPVASPILRQTPAMDCLLASLAFSHQP